jgi:hypothetical protein
MTQPKPSAAQALYPHLARGTPDEVEQRRKPNSVAEAMWPRPQPQRPRESMFEEYPWTERMLAAGALRRVR